MSDYIKRLTDRLGIENYAPIKYAFDVALWVLVTPFAFLIRLEEAYLAHVPEILVLLFAGVIVKALMVYAFGLHRQSWHKVGVRDLFTLMYVMGVSALIFLALAYILRPSLSIPRSVPFLDSSLGLIMLGGLRLAIRLLYEQELRGKLLRPGRRVLIVGAGEAGTMIAREMLRHPEAGLIPVGFLDDEPSKQRNRYAGIPVVGLIDDLPGVVRRMNIAEVLIAIPSASGEVIRHVVKRAREATVRHRIIPGIYDILSGKVSISQIREVDVEDLLRRDPIRLNQDEIAAYVAGRTVLITGAGGSIGSELVRQITPFNPGKLILLDRDENNLYMFERELRSSQVDVPYRMIVADIQRKVKLEYVFAEYNPQVVFHAAAHKHVPVMERNPEEAIFNNIQGTKILLETSLKHGVERFVNISTDKAVCPTSIMGASKRVAEYLVIHTSRQASSGQAFVSVRFGNVLGSRGSVVPLFKQQIKKGGPVTITHHEMTRYFMSIPEATQLVLQAAGFSENGALYILDMGQPVRIVDLAEELIKLSGFEVYKDIDIQFVGIRPGEKMHEKLLTSEEDLISTRHDHILIVKNEHLPDESLFETGLQELFAAADACDQERIQQAFKKLIPTYEPNSLKA